MFFDRVLGYPHIKQHLQYSAEQGRIPHAQLFLGPEGSGTLAMAIAYAQYVLCELESDADKKELCRSKLANFNHPDLHFVYPVNTNESGKKVISSDFQEDWQSFLNEQVYGNLFDWYRKIGIEKKQGNISVREAKDILHKMSLKSFEGGYKVLIIWMAEQLHNDTSNKLLKLIEEPPEKTLLILIAEDENQLLQTIQSRCQKIQFPAFSEEMIGVELIKKYNLAESVATSIAHRSNGNFNKALDLLNEDSEDLTFEKWFVYWVRSAFKAKEKRSVINELLDWSTEISKTGRETQKHFLLFCMQLFRQAMLQNYGVNNLVYIEMRYDNFKFDKFAPFVHEGNILEITKALEEAIFHIERNGNAKVIFTDLSVNLTRFLHSPAR